MVTKLDVARWLSSGSGSGNSVSRYAKAGGVSGTPSAGTSMRYGYAMADSLDGWVTVKLDTSEESIACVCDSPVKQGQRVQVWSQNGQLKAQVIGQNIVDESVKDSVVDVGYEYAAGEDDENPPSEGWSESYPTTADYVWQRMKTTKGDGTVKYSTPACISKPPEGYDRDATYYATSSTGTSTSDKVATVQSGGSFSLDVGTTVSVAFTNANSASSPTLNVNSTGAKPIRTNGTPYAYWSSGASVLFVYDGTYWQVASTPVYANTVTVGNPASKNVYVDGSHVAIRNGTTEYATFLADDIHLGLNAVTDSNVYLFNDCMVMSATDSSSSGWDGTDASLYIKPVPGKTPKELSLMMDDASYVSIKPESGPSSDPSTVVSSARHAVVQATASRGLVDLRALDGSVHFSTDVIDLGNTNSIRKPAITIGAAAASIEQGMTSSNAILTGATTINVVNGTSLVGLDHFGTQISRSGNYVQVRLQAGATAYFEASAMAYAASVSNSNFAFEIYASRYSGSGSVTPSSSLGSLGTYSGFASGFVTPQLFTLRNTSSTSQATFRFCVMARVSNGTGLVQGWMLTVKMI